ncbi:MAG: aldehyde dehydrogenase [Firmicutes bacterium]|nr:aldehyde dehydrogenase [Bacillota bacterium]
MATEQAAIAMKVAMRMESGGVGINGPDAIALPFGGYKMSGLGREGASTTLEEMSQVKAIVLKGVR